MKAKLKRLLELFKLIEELKKEVLNDEVNSLSPEDPLKKERPYIRHKTSVLEQMVTDRDESYEERCEAINELNLREEKDEFIYVVKKTIHTNKERVFETDEELVKWLRNIYFNIYEGCDVWENNTDEYIINKALSIGEVKKVKIGKDWEREDNIPNVLDNSYLSIIKNDQDKINKYYKHLVDNCGYDRYEIKDIINPNTRN